MFRLTGWSRSEDWNELISMMPNDLRHLRNGLIAATCFFVVVYLLDGWLHQPIGVIHALFDLNAESTFPAWYTSSQLLLAGVLYLLAANHSRLGTNIASWRLLLLFGLLLVFLSADEAAQIHERVTSVLRPFESLPRFSGGHGMWIPVYLSGGVLLLLLTGRFWKELWRYERRGTGLCALGAVLFLAGAVGLEALSYGDLREEAYRYLYLLEIAAEEGLEMFGATAILLGSFRIFHAFSNRSLPDGDLLN